MEGFGIGLNGFGLSVFADLPPKLQDLVLWTHALTDDTGELYLDTRSGVGDWTQFEAISLAIAPGQTITFAGMAAGVTVTSHSGTATVALVSGTLSCSVGGSLYDLILSDGSTYDCAQGIGSTNIIAGQVGGIVGVLVGFTLPDAWVYSISFGHEWGPHSEYILADGITIGGEPVVGNIPPSSTGSDFDVVGNTLTNPGEGRNDFHVTGTTGDWDGVTYGVLDEVVVLSGDFDITWLMVYSDNSVDSAILGSNSTSTEGLLWINSDTNNKIQFFFGGAGYSFVNVSLVDGEKYNMIVSRVGTNLTLTINDVSETLTCVTNDIIFRYISGWIDASVPEKLFTGTLPSIQIYDATNTLIHDWLVESRKDSNQPTIYDRVGGNHATLQDATLGVDGFWKAKKGGSELFKYGFRDDGTSLIPARADGLAADGNPLTQSSAKLSGTHCKLYANESLSMYNLSVLAGVDADLYLAGSAIGLTPDEWVALITGGNLNDSLMLSTSRNMIIGWNPALTGDDITRALDYLRIT